MKDMKIYIDGEYFSKDNAKISVFDHGLLYGDGIFEGLRIYGGKVFLLDKHLDRLYNSALALSLTIPMSREDMKMAVEETVALNERVDGYIRLVVTRGAGTLGLDPDRCPKASVIIIADNISLYPQENYRDGIPVVTASSRRLGPDGLDPRIKNLNYLNNILAKIEAKQAGCMEAVMLNREGNVAECSADNIFIFKNGVLKTPDPTQGALAGLTRGFVLELAKKEAMEVKETILTRYDLYTADECFMTGSGAEIMPVNKIDGRVIGGGKCGPLTEKLRSLFTQAVGNS